MSEPTKGSVFSVLVMSRLLYNVHTWSWITDADVECWRMVSKHRLRPWLSRKSGSPSFHFSTAELCAIAGLHSPVDMLHANRLRYVRRAISTAPAALWGLLHDNPHGNSWLPHLQESYQWMLQHLRPGLMPQCQDAHELLQTIAVDQKWHGI